jgi:hypothetical protein
MHCQYAIPNTRYAIRYPFKAIFNTRRIQVSDAMAELPGDETSWCRHGDPTSLSQYSEEMF